jgi:hypothetical protein
MGLESLVCHGIAWHQIGCRMAQQEAWPVYDMAMEWYCAKEQHSTWYVWPTQQANASQPVPGLEANVAVMLGTGWHGLVPKNSMAHGMYMTYARE